MCYALVVLSIVTESANEGQRLGYEWLRDRGLGFRVRVEGLGMRVHAYAYMQVGR